MMERGIDYKPNERLEASFREMGLDLRDPYDPSLPHPSLMMNGERPPVLVRLCLKDGSVEEHMTPEDWHEIGPMEMDILNLDRKKPKWVSKHGRVIEEHPTLGTRYPPVSFRTKGKGSTDHYLKIPEANQTIHRMTRVGFIHLTTIPLNHVDHRDRNKISNYLPNLQFATPSENAKNTLDYEGENVSYDAAWAACLDLMRGQSATIRDAARRNGLKVDSLYRVLKGQTLRQKPIQGLINAFLRHLR